MIISISSVLFSIGSLSIRWYGIFLMLAIMVVLWWGWRAVKKQNKITTDHMITAAIIAIPAGIIFSRALHVVDEMRFYAGNPDQILGADGLTIYGALIGGVLGIWIYSRIAKFSFSDFMVMVIPAIPLAQAVGRVGCIFNGCCYGLETTVPWGITYTNPNSFGPLFVKVHPTQFYEIIFLLFAFFIIYKVLRGRLMPPIMLLVAYIGMYSAWRFGIGFLRAGSTFMFGLQQAQVVALILMAICVSILAYKGRWGKAASAVEPASSAVAEPEQPAESDQPKTS